jgi:hypothetical protein
MMKLMVAFSKFANAPKKGLAKIGSVCPTAFRIQPILKDAFGK